MIQFKKRLPSRTAVKYTLGLAAAIYVVQGLFLTGMYFAGATTVHGREPESLGYFLSEVGDVVIVLTFIPTVVAAVWWWYHER